MRAWYKDYIDRLEEENSLLKAHIDYLQKQIDKHDSYSGKVEIELETKPWDSIVKFYGKFHK